MTKQLNKNKVVYKTNYFKRKRRKQHLNNNFILLKYYIMFLITAIVLVLGCHINEILKDRIDMALQLTDQYELNTTMWFLTGSGKEAIVSESEARKMSKQFNGMNIVLDELATNTAENFANLKLYLNQHNVSTNEMPDIIINTSEFHQERAGRIFKHIFPDIEPKWNLGKVACSYCWADEQVHMVNVENDAKKALAKINQHLLVLI